MADLPTFIRENTEPILAEWESFARGLPVAATMDIAALRDHAKEMLVVIARDLERPQTGGEQAEKAKGRSDSTEKTRATAAQEHGAGRADSGFTVEQMVAEFRALRASVIRLWTRQQAQAGPGELEEMTRFNEAIDQAIAESIAQYTTQVGQSKEKFLAILGHDLRTPLGAIITSSQFLLDSQPLVEPQLTLMTGIASSARRMNQMVADLLGFTRTSFGDRMPIDRAPADLNGIIREVVAEIRATYPRSTVHFEPDGDLRGEWDSARLAQALTNLVGNAVHHGMASLPITVRATGDPEAVVVTVHNFGRPIPEADFEKIFQAMAQGAGEERRNPRHFGLGLYIVDMIVKAHGGSIAVQSSAGAGTTFTVSLRRRPLA